jgi:hypothetical protein
MKLIISLLTAITCHFAFAEQSAAPHETKKHEAGGHEGTEKDWNEVFKQPISNQNLSQMPQQSQILEPGFLSQVKGTEVTLKWKAVEGVKYHLQVATDPNYKWLVANEPLVTYTEFALKDLKPNQQYFWRVFTQKPGNQRGYTKSLAVGSEFETAQ